MDISVIMSAIFFCIIWLFAMGRPNCILHGKKEVIHQYKLKQGNSVARDLPTTTTTTACVYLGRQIALPMMGSYTWFSYLIFLVFSLVVLLLFLGWSGCCQICHLSLFSLYHRRVFLCTFRGRVLVIQRLLCIYGIWYPSISP